MSRRSLQRSRWSARARSSLWTTSDGSTNRATRSVWRAVDELPRYSDISCSSRLRTLAARRSASLEAPASATITLASSRVRKQHYLERPRLVLTLVSCGSLPRGQPPSARHHRHLGRGARRCVRPRARQIGDSKRRADPPDSSTIALCLRGQTRSSNCCWCRSWQISSRPARNRASKP